MIRFGDDNENLPEMPFILSISDTTDSVETNSLTVTVALSVIGEPGEGADKTGIPALDALLIDSRPVYPDMANVYEITFTDYIIYQTRCESYVVSDGEEIWTGKYFTVFTKSKLLDSLPQLTIAHRSDDGSYYPGKWTHYGISAQNHIIDVIATSEPKIRKLRAEK